MAKLVSAFNAGAVDPTQSAYSFVPSGVYKVAAQDSEVKPTKANNGGYLQFDLRVLEGEHSGAVVPLRLNLYNSNQTAVDIANRQLAAMCYAVGKPNAIINDSAELHNLPFMVRIEEKEGQPYTDRQTGETKAGNKQSEIKMILGLDGKPPVKGGGNAAPAQTAPATPPQPQQPPAQPPVTQGQGQPPAWGQPAQPPAQPPQGQPPAWGQQPQQPAAQPPAQQPPAWGQGQGQPAMGQGMPPQQPAQGGPPAWGQPPAGAWGGPAQ